MQPYEKDSQELSIIQKMR